MLQKRGIYYGQIKLIYRNLSKGQTDKFRWRIDTLSMIWGHWTDFAEKRRPNLNVHSLSYLRTSLTNSLGDLLLSLNWDGLTHDSLFHFRQISFFLSELCKHLYS